MKIFLWIVGIAVLLVMIPAVIIFSNMIFISQITQLKVQFSSEYKSLVDGLRVSEVDHDDPPLAKEDPDTGDIENGLKMLLYEDGSVKEGRRVFDDDPGTEVIVAINKFRKDAHIFSGNDVFQYTDDHRGNKLGSFSSPGFSHVDFVLPVNERYMIVSGAMNDSQYPSERVLWQVEYDSLDKIQLTSEPYYTFQRPPKIFVFEDPAEQVVVYYTGSYDYAFGGDASRPRYSVIRIYNSQYPDGLDVIKFGFKAGTIIEVNKVNDGYLVTGDPSLPAMAGKPRVSPVKWKLVVR